MSENRAFFRVSVINTQLIVATMAFSVLGVFSSDVPTWARLLIVVVAIGLTASGHVGSLLAASRAKKKADEVTPLLQELKTARDAVDPSSMLRAIDSLAMVLFRGDEAWRLSAYVIEADEELGRRLRLAFRRSGSEEYESSGREIIPLKSSFLRSVDDYDLRSATRVHVNHSNSLPDRRIEPDAWAKMHAQFMPLKEARLLRMPTRVYAWCATRDPESGQTLALMAESLNPDGIAFDVLESPIVPQWLALTIRATSAEAIVKAPIAKAERLLAQGS